MNLTDKHPAELEFHKMIEEVKSLLDKCENQYLDSVERDSLRGDMEEIKQKIFNLQIERLSSFIDDTGKIQNLPKEEEQLQREITGQAVVSPNFFN